MVSMMKKIFFSDWIPCARAV